MKYLLCALIALAILSCKQNTEAEVKTAPSQSMGTVATSDDLNKTKATVAITFKTEEATQIHQAYLELKAAFVNTDTGDASAIARDFKQMLSAVSETERVTKLISDLGLIADSNEIEEQRSAFENVSMRVEFMLSGNIATGTLIKQYCPMAFNGKGAYWLSDSQEVRNPYYGDKMLTCGVVDTEIQ